MMVYTATALPMCTPAGNDSIRDKWIQYQPAREDGVTTRGVTGSEGLAYGPQLQATWSVIAQVEGQLNRMITLSGRAAWDGYIPRRLLYMPSQTMVR